MEFFIFFVKLIQLCLAGGRKDTWETPQQFDWTQNTLCMRLVNRTNVCYLTTNWIHQGSPKTAPPQVSKITNFGTYIYIAKYWSLRARSFPFRWVGRGYCCDREQRRTEAPLFANESSHTHDRGRDTVPNWISVIFSEYVF